MEYNYKDYLNFKAVIYDGQHLYWVISGHLYPITLNIYNVWLAGLKFLANVA